MKLTNKFLLFLSVGVFLQMAKPLGAQILNENCTVSINGQIVNAGFGGEFQIRNVPVGNQLVRITAVCVENGQTIYGRSDFIQVAQGQVLRISENDMAFSSTPFPGLDTLKAVPDDPIMTTIGQTTQMSVTGTYSDTTFGELDITGRIFGSTYITSNPAIAAVDSNGLVTANAAGNAFITVNNEGMAAIASIFIAPGDPLTKVMGFVQLDDTTFVQGAEVSILGQAGLDTTAADGSFSIDSVATTLGPLTIEVEAQIGGKLYLASVTGIQPVPGGLTDAGIITLTPIKGLVRVQGILDWSSGTMSGSGITISEGQLMIPGGSIVELFGGRLENRGTGTWGGTLRANNGSIFENETSGSIDITGDGIIMEFFQAAGMQPVFVNAGSLTKSAGTDTARFGQIIFANSGTIEVQSGVLAFTDVFSQAAGSIILNGGDLRSTQPMNILGGDIFGFGNLTSDVSNSGQFNPGLSAGILNLNGQFIQFTAGAINIEIGGLTVGSQFDQLNISGAATLGGALNITLINGFTPTAGNSFQIMTFASRSGSFGTVNGLNIGGGLQFSLNFSSTDLTLVVQ